jgi:ribulose-5-phosphate 4-epimerase/fuculose-1-phosphate aldolase
LREQDLSIVDLDNRQVFGVRQQTSKILLHLEIYKAVPRPGQSFTVTHPMPLPMPWPGLFRKGN